MSETNNNILNLDEFLPEPRKIIMGGKEIDVSVIPTRVSLELMKNADKFKKFAAKGEDAGDELFDEVLDICIKIIKPSFSEITRDWLIDNTKDIFQLSRLIEFTMKPLTDRLSESKKK